MKKFNSLLSIILVAVIVFSLCLNSVTALASVSGTDISGNNVAGVATNEVNTAFDYVSSEDASVNVSLDVSENVKAEVLNSNFNDLAVGSTVTSVNVGEGDNISSYDGVKGITATVVAREEGNNCISIGEWAWNRFNIYDGGSYDATFWMQTYNREYGQYNIQIKPDIYLAYRGTQHSNGHAHAVGLYRGYSDVGNEPETMLESKEAVQLAYVDLSQYGALMGDNAYWRIVSTYNTVKVYVSAVNDFSKTEPIIEATVPADRAGERSILQFSQGNTGMFIDDVVVNEIGNTLNENKTLVKDVTFDGPVKGNTKMLYQYVSGDNYSLTTDGIGDIYATLYPRVIGNYSAEFYIAHSNNQWHEIYMSIRDTYQLWFRGYGNAGTESGQLVINGNYFAIPDITAGLNVKYEYTGTAIRVWVVAASGFTGEYPETPTAEITLEAPLGDENVFDFYMVDGILVLDDIKIKAANGHIIYQEDFNGSGAFAYAAPAVLGVDGTTGNVYYAKGIGEDWSENFLFNAPENYEMTYLVDPYNGWCNSRVYLKNSINVHIFGTDAGGGVFTLRDGNDVLATYNIGSNAALGNAPFDAGYIKAIFKGQNLKVYVSTVDFSNTALVFDYTFENLVTENNAIRIDASNAGVNYDDFKVYDLGDSTETIYKKLQISGREMKLLNVTATGTNEISTYTLPFADAKYRISVGKKDNKLTVYIDGTAVMETDSAIKGLIYCDGVTPKVEFGTITPKVIRAGDFDLDGALTAPDLATLRKVILGVDNESYYITTLNVDNSEDGVTNILDLVRLKKLMAQ